MKRITICFFILFVGIQLPVYAQVDTSTTQKLLQYIMQPLDKGQIPTGYLEEYGCPTLSMATFNGTLTDSNRMDMQLWPVSKQDFSAMEFPVLCWLPIG